AALWDAERARLDAEEAGFHRHQRRLRWRRKRCMTMGERLHLERPVRDAVERALADIARKASTGDEAALRELRARAPTEQLAYLGCGDLEYQLEEKIIQTSFGDGLGRRAIAAQLRLLRDRLAGPHARRGALGRARGPLLARRPSLRAGLGEPARPGGCPARP